MTTTEKRDEALRALNDAAHMAVRAQIDHTEARWTPEAIHDLQVITTICRSTDMLVEKL
jgi:uncharacterized protein YajQ (UPF0234 family)